MDFSSKKFKNIPEEVIGQLRFFYTPKFWRSEKDWRAAHPKKLNHGQKVVIKYNRKERGDSVVFGFKDSDGINGRFVFMWNNIGRVISADGRVHYCCFYCR